MEFSLLFLCVTFLLPLCRIHLLREAQAKWGRNPRRPQALLLHQLQDKLLADKKKGLISDTTCTGLTKTTWQGTYNLIEAEEPKVTVTEATADPLRKSDATLKDLADSFLHRIAAREQILPYTDVVRWAIEEIPIIDRTFTQEMGEFSGRSSQMI